MLFRFSDALKRLIKKNGIYNRTNTASSFEYTDLAPTDSISPESEYFKALSCALYNPKIKSIALSGPYGSGKSSIIDSYLKYNKDVSKSSIKISMASFEDELSNEGNKDVEMSILEKGILKQLFYKVNHKKIPQSRYRKLHKISLLSVYFNLIIFLLATFVITYIFCPDIIIDFYSKIIIAGNSVRIPDFISVIFSIILILGCIYPISVIIKKIISHGQIKEIKLPTDTTIETKTDPDSIFDKNMDEIMYFFEVTKYRMVFFEDFDRFNNCEIFVKLRELNTLLNNNENINNKIVFVYAIKDDIFKTNEERTKFFDFIIPVIPVMNSTNAGDILIEKFSSIEGHDISTEYILDVSPYISDMRILQNICNEFILYKRTLQREQSLDLKDEKMFSLIILKNIFPKVFSEMQAETGLVKSLFSSIQSIKKKLSQIEEREIENDEHVLLNVQKDVLKECKEIKISLLSALTDWKGVVSNISIRSSQNNYQYNASSIMSDSFDLNRFDCRADNFRATVSWFDYTGNSKSSITVDKEVFLPYIARWENIMKTENERKNEIQQRIERNKKKIIEINNYTLKELIDKYGIQQVLSSDVLENELLSFLLRRGYLNEEYSDYINYFKGQCLTKDDMNYILSIKNQHSLPYDFRLSKVDMIISKLQEYEFETCEIYNFDMLEALLSSDKKYGNKLDCFISQLADDEESWDFIDVFFDITHHKEKLISIISHKNHGFWELIYNNSSLTYERQVMYLKYILMYASTEDVGQLNVDESLSSFMKENENILQMLLNNTDGISVSCAMIINTIKNLGIKFDRIIVENLPDELINYIFDNNNYVINKHMIKSIVEQKAPELSSKINCCNYSTIIKMGYEPLLNYINSNLDEYMEAVFFSEGNKKECVDAIILLIQKYINDSDKCRRIISHEDFLVENIESFCGDYTEDENSWVKSIWNQLLTENKVEPQWDNIVSYRNRFGYNNTLQKYISDNIEKIVASNNDNVIDDLILEILNSDIQDKALESILKHNKLKESNIDINNASESRIGLLIKLQYIPFSISYYNVIVSKAPGYTIQYISNNKSDFLNNIDAISIPQNIIIALLNNGDFDDEFKLTVIEHKSNDMDTELAELILNRSFQISKRTFNAVWNYLDEENKNKLLLKHYRLLNCDDLENCFKILQKLYPNFHDRTRRHEESIAYSEENVEFADYLKKISYITNYDIRKKDKSNDVKTIVCRIKAQ